jgi:hypothetical protein
MPTYREFLLQTLSVAQDCTFEQALRWMDAYERDELGKTELRPKKKRASRLSKTLAELQQLAPARSQPSPLAKLQPIVRNSTIEAALPCEPDRCVVGPFFASYRDSTFDATSYATIAYQSWVRYRKIASSATNEVFFSPVSPRKTSDELQDDRGEFGTQSVQLTEIFTRMLCSKDPQEREYATTFRRPEHRIDYSNLSVDDLTPQHFVPDATYIRDGLQVHLFLPCAFWGSSKKAFPSFIAWLVEQCHSRKLCYEMWQPGLIRDSGP